MSTTSNTKNDSKRWQLLDGEFLCLTDEVHELRGSNWIKGKLFVTNYRIVFEPVSKKCCYLF